jgi:hypothetical protein
MKKFKLLLLDADVVIYLFSLGIWDEVVERCDVHLAKTVIDEEAHFYETEDGERYDFELRPYADAGRIAEFSLTPSGLAGFLTQFDPVYLEKLDAGEAESLAYLLTLQGECRICSADKIVYRVLGNLRLGERGISLEEILQQTGLGRGLRRQFSEAYREEWTKKGFDEGMRGLGVKKPKGK